MKLQKLIDQLGQNKEMDGQEELINSEYCFAEEYYEMFEARYECMTAEKAMENLNLNWENWPLFYFQGQVPKRISILI